MRRDALNPPGGLDFNELRRRGLTLVEIILVLALLIVIAAITVPTLEGTFSRAALDGAGNVVRGAWAKARLAAMQSGEPYLFRFEPNGGRFQVVALDQISLPENSGLPADDSDGQHEPADRLRLRENRLPDGVTFATGDMAASAQLTALAPDAVQGAWSAPILFNPDGTTSDASIVVENDKQVIRVTLRGLTGISNVTDATASEAAQ